MEGGLIVREYRPSEDEFNNPKTLLESIISECQNVGLAKIIPPKQHYVAVNVPENFELKNCVRQQTQKFGKTDLFQIPYGCGDAMSLRDYKAMAEQFEQKQMTLDEAEEKFWTMDLERENDHGRLPTYAIDNEISLFSSDYNTWNLNKFQGGSILSGKEMKGINTSYTNYGMYQTCFPMHVEDSNLASLNILHQGATKIWYGVPATMATKLEAISKDEISEESRCDFFLRHKTLLYSPKLLRENGVEFGKVYQNMGDIIVTMYNGYHQGFNTGFNCSESVNYATPNWKPYYESSKLCSCTSYGKASRIRHDLLGNYLKNLQPKIEHLPIIDEKKSRSLCMAKCGQRTNVYCTTCKMFFCFTSTQNCYADYHKKLDYLHNAHIPVYSVGKSRPRCFMPCNPNSNQTQSHLTKVFCDKCEIYLCFNHNRNCFF